MSPKVRILNRKVHIYLGLALLLFVILFSGTGLLLNHHWAFEDFWPQRQTTDFERTFKRPNVTGDMAMARDLMAQLGFRGEVNQMDTTPDGRFTIHTGRPGESLKIDADLTTGRATVRRVTVNGWGVVRTLHTFVGVSADDPTQARDWWMTRIWSLALDLTAIGLILLVMGGLIEAWAANPRRTLGLLTFGLAGVACAAFVIGRFPQVA